MTERRRACALASLAAILALGCAAEEPIAEAFPLRFVASSDGAPVAGTRIEVRGVEVGTTDEDGTLDVLLPAHEGESVGIRARCPDAYRSPDGLPRLTLRPLRSLTDPDALRRIRIELECRPRERTAMLLVRGGGLASMPVLIDGREIGRTDAHGLAHVELRYAPHTSVEVVLGTDHYADLRPRNPARTFTIPDRDDVLVFDQSFERAAAVAPAAPRVRPPPAKLPERIR